MLFLTNRITKRELNMQVNIKTKNRKELQVEALMDSRYTHIGINEQLVKNKRVQTKLADFFFKIFNADRTKNEEVTRITLLKIEINGHREQIDAVVIYLNGIDMFLGYDWLVKYNPEVNWKEGKIWFIRCPKLFRIRHQV